MWVSLSPPLEIAFVASYIMSLFCFRGITFPSLGLVDGCAQPVSVSCQAMGIWGLEELGREEGGEQELLFVCLFVYPTTHHQSCVLMNMAGKVLNSPPLHCHVTVGETMP